MKANMDRVAPETPSAPGHALRKHAIVAVAPATGEEAVVRWYARLIGGRFDSRIHVVRAPPASKPFALKEWLAAEGNAASDGPGREAERPPMGFLVAAWDRDMERLQALMLQTAALDVPAVFVRQDSLENIRRVLVATAWGPHTLHLMWLAREIAVMLNVPMRIVRVSHPDEMDGAHAPLIRPWPIVGMTDPQFMGLAKGADNICTEDCVRGIEKCLRSGDLLVMGVPGSSIVAGDFGKSVPGSVARLADTPMVLLRARQSGCPTLRHLFWGSLIQLKVRPKDKFAVLESLVDSLIRHNQAPASCKSDLLQRAVDREQVASTAVDCQTAFPHIRLPGFTGVAGALAVCPDGVDFESPDGSLTKFVCLLVTSDGFCDEYLAVLAHITRRLIRPEVRDALLSCTAPADALDVLEPSNETTVPSV